MSLIIHPEVNKLKEQLTQRIYEYDNLVNHVCPEIERRYVLEFGLHEYKLYSLELEIDKLRRKLHLIQIEINHENEINMDVIDKIIAKEFEEYDKQVQAQIDEINFINENNPEKLSESDSKKLKKIYRCLVKRLHPDLNPNQSLFELSLFYKAVQSFQQGDLRGLESVVAILPDENAEEACEIDNLKKLINEYEELIDKVKNDYPYNKKNLLDNRDDHDKYMSMILELIHDRQKDIEKLENNINSLI